jgi:hypothetical protein
MWCRSFMSMSSPAAVGDAAWPRPVWGVVPPLAHDAAEVQNFISAIRKQIWLG